MRIICYADGWTMIPISVAVRTTEIITYYKCPYCDKMVLLDQEYPCDQPVSVKVDTDIEDVRRI